MPWRNSTRHYDAYVGKELVGKISEQDGSDRGIPITT
jgi:hypothetical protein